MATVHLPHPTIPTPAERAKPSVDTDYPSRRVPAHARRRTLSLAIVIAGFFFYTPTMVTGGQVAGAFRFSEFMGLAFAATLILAVYIGLLAVASARTGLTTVLLSRLTLGRLGGKWASLILGGTQVGWYAISIGILGDLLAAAFGWDAAWPVVVIGGALMATTAYAGFKGIEILSWLSVPLMMILCAIVFVQSVGHVGGWSSMLEVEGAGGMTPGLAITMMVGSFISGGTQIGNWSRFDNGRGLRVFLFTSAAVVVVQFAMLFFGGIGAAAFGEPDFTTLLMSMGMHGAAVVLLVANLWTTNDNTAYAFGVAGAEFFGRKSKSPFIIGGVLVAVVLALTGAANSLTGFLVLLGIVIPPLGGTLIGTFFLAWGARDPGTNLDDVPAFRATGILSYLGGAAAAVTCTVGEFGSPALIGILVSAVLAGVLGRTQARRRAAV